ncbi:uncharacterized protein BO80DRAFT_442293 [Aspergillus ibericus CBS 121593]|uniref:Uncharacterized protein n=1 Tax=Aspergillus ibericus CBS 121593 TaxID=1448316 RepID=A0A395H6Z3_9EURO|nr:hypothetical protein BO80DRAFT_442293 [Aspergillus ibericus CBS 121593]RAL03711.1 hypothetical protein BO80DRAFT_442293 [Aspergillus ibericus CBS 121593]
MSSYPVATATINGKPSLFVNNNGTLTCQAEGDKPNQFNEVTVQTRDDQQPITLDEGSSVCVTEWQGADTKTNYRIYGSCNKKMIELASSDQETDWIYGDLTTHHIPAVDGSTLTATSANTAAGDLIRVYANVTDTDADCSVYYYNDTTGDWSFDGDISIIDPGD